LHCAQPTHWIVLVGLIYIGQITLTQHCHIIFLNALAHRVIGASYNDQRVNPGYVGAHGL